MTKHEDTTAHTRALRGLARRSAATADSACPRALPARRPRAPQPSRPGSLLVLAGAPLGQRLRRRLPRPHRRPAAGRLLRPAHLTAAARRRRLRRGRARLGARVLAARLSRRRLLAPRWARCRRLGRSPLALGDGAGGLSAPLTSRYEYLAAVARVGSPLPFLQSFTTGLPLYPDARQGPPARDGAALWGLARAGLGGPGPARRCHRPGRPRRPRRAGGRLCDSPASARRGPRRPTSRSPPARCGSRRQPTRCSPGSPPAASPAWPSPCTPRPAVRCWWRWPVACCSAARCCSPTAPPRSGRSRSRSPGGRAPAANRARLAVAAGGVAAVVLAFGRAGFWWSDGLRATRELYYGGGSRRRPYLDFLVISPAAFALAWAPRSPPGWRRCATSAPGRSRAPPAPRSRARRPERPLARRDRAHLAAFRPWLLLHGRAAPSPAWLAAQLALALALQAGVRSPW